MDRRLTTIGGLLLLLALFFAVNILAGAAFRSARVDLTNEKLYTLSPGARAIAAGIDEPIRLYYYFSASQAQGTPMLETYGRRVRELLEEFTLAAKGNIILEVIDPEPFSEAEDEAASSGLRNATGRGGGTFFFGLVGTNAVDGREIIPIFNPNDEQFLEYEVARLIYTLAHPERPTVGVISSLPLDGVPGNPQMGAPGKPAWQIMAEIRALFDVQMIPITDAEIPEGIDVLLVVHPKNLNPKLEYAIDQYVVGGGHAVIFIDPLCEVDIPAAARNNPMAVFQLERSSNLPTLLTAWGVPMKVDVIAADVDRAQRVATRDGNRSEPVSYVAWLALGSDDVDPDDPATGRLATLNLATAGVLDRDEGATTTWTPLLQTTTESMELSAESLKFFPQPKDLLTAFVSEGQQLTIAGRLTGEVASAYPDGPPAEFNDDGEAAAGHVTLSEGPVNIIVVTDCDMLHDQFWVRQQRLFGQINVGLTKVADNGDFLINVLENMVGSNDLISVRARGRFARPFDRVDDIRRASEKEYLAEEQRLQETLKETEEKINELQAQRPDQAGGQIILTDEQRAEIERFNEQRRETRKQLRNVRHDLNRDIEVLGLKLKIINVGLMPLIVAVVAIGLGLYRVRRRRTDRRAAAHT